MGAFVMKITGFVLIMTGFFSNMTGFVLNMTDFVSNIAGLQSVPSWLKFKLVSGSEGCGSSELYWAWARK